MTKKVGEHDFRMPTTDNSSRPPYATFSIGVFEWVKALNKAGIKPGKAKVRIVGVPTKQGWKDVHDKAIEVANALDAGTYEGPKRLVV